MHTKKTPSVLTPHTSSTEPQMPTTHPQITSTTTAARPLPLFQLQRGALEALRLHLRRYERPATKAVAACTYDPLRSAACIARATSSSVKRSVIALYSFEESLRLNNVPDSGSSDGPLSLSSVVST